MASEMNGGNANGTQTDTTASGRHTLETRHELGKKEAEDGETRQKRSSKRPGERHSQRVNGISS